MRFPKGVPGALLTAATVCACLSVARAQETVVIVGSGSSIPTELYRAWANGFNALKGPIRAQYMPSGASDGIWTTVAGNGDFAAGEIPSDAAQLHGPKISLLPIPMALVGIVPLYNLPTERALNFSGGLLAQIYLGSVKNWKDPQIAKLNPNVDLPDLPIRVVHRGPGTGSNFIFTDFLSKSDPQFRTAVGRSASPRWPVGLIADHRHAMVALVAATPGAIGYVDLAAAHNSGVRYGAVENASGRFITATAATLEAAYNAAANSRTGDLSLVITNAPGKDSYPIASFTWMYVPMSGTPLARRHALKEFLLWGLQDGQKVTTALGYAPLPGRIAAQALAAVNALP